MSKQATANELYNEMITEGYSRKDIIERIRIAENVSAAYASTLYNNARKASTPNDKVASAMASTVRKPKIERFDRPTLRRFRSTLEAKLAEIEEEFGVTMNIGSIRFSDTDFTARLSCGLGNADEAAQREWDQNCFFFGLKSDDFGRTFTDRGTPFTVTGIKPKSRKYPVLATNSNGTTYKFPASVLK